MKINKITIKIIKHIDKLYYISRPFDRKKLIMDFIQKNLEDWKKNGEAKEMIGLNRNYCLDKRARQWKRNWEESYFWRSS